MNGIKKRNGMNEMEWNKIYKERKSNESKLNEWNRIMNEMENGWKIEWNEIMESNGMESIESNGMEWND